MENPFSKKVEELTVTEVIVVNVVMATVITVGCVGGAIVIGSVVQTIDKIKMKRNTKTIQIEE